MYQNVIKRILDVVFSLIGLLVLWPLLLVLFVLVTVKLGNPAIFCQKRPGKNGQIFSMYKFRTMTNQKDENGILLSDEIRLTSFGKLLRKTSLDELPELWNIFCGKMSFVGPRPLLVEYLPLYNEEQKHRHDVRPGLTGLAQVNGRNAISWEKKFEYDCDYVKNITFMSDVSIVFSTFKKVFVREGISSDASATMEKFEGTKETSDL